MSQPGPGGAGDATLYGELSTLLRSVDPVPAHVVEAARASIGWRDLDSELARLTADSMLVGADVRGEQGRLLSYEAGDRTIEVEVGESGGGLRIIGQLVPPQAARVRVEQPAGSVEVTADPLGRFTVRDLPPGLTRFACQPLAADDQPAGSAYHSEWKLL